jgi:hypothetical protein
VRYWYFDPWTESYQLAEAAPDSVLVAPGALAAADTGTVVVPPLMIRTAYRGALPVPPHERREFWLLLGLAPIPATLRRLTTRRRARARPQPLSRDVRALARQRRPVSPAELRRVLVRALADRLQVPASTLTSNGALARTVRRTGVSAAVAGEADALLAELDRAAFGAAHEKVRDAANRAWRIYRDIDRQARTREALRAAITGSALGVMLVVLTQSAVAMQMTELSPARQFDAGLTAYRAERYSDAARHFGAAAIAEPRAPDAWMNYGSASWQAADTARAVLGWQRALRLEPLATDAREALVLVDLPVDESFGDVPPLPVATLAVIAGSLWCLAWIVVAIRARKAGAAAVGLGGIALSISLAAVALTAHSVVLGRGLAVLDATGALRALPALAAEYGAVARVGEVARIAERRGDWTRIALAGAREGWVENALLVKLTRD